MRCLASRGSALETRRLALSTLATFLLRCNWALKQRDCRGSARPASLQAPPCRQVGGEGGAGQAGGERSVTTAQNLAAGVVACMQSTKRTQCSCRELQFPQTLLFAPPPWPTRLLAAPAPRAMGKPCSMNAASGSFAAVPCCWPAPRSARQSGEFTQWQVEGEVLRRQ